MQSKKTAVLKFKVQVLLTCVYSLEVDVLLQLTSQVDLSAVLAHRPIIHQEEMGMQIVENVKFAERVQQRLIRSNNLQCGYEKAIKRNRRGDNEERRKVTSVASRNNPRLTPR